MKNSPEYRAAVCDLAAASESCSLPSYEIENQAAIIAASFAVSDDEVREDVAVAARCLVASEPDLPPFVLGSDPVSAYCRTTA